MKKMQFLIAVFSAAIMFSCATSENENQNNGPKKNVSVKILASQLSRAADKTTIPAGDVSVVNDVMVFFLDASDRIVDAPGTMNTAEVSSGKVFSGVNPATAKVYIVANTNNGGNPIFSGLAALGVNNTKAQIEALAATVDTQMDASAKGTGNILLSGEADLEQVDATNYTVQVPVTPAVCRFEVTAISGINDITAFDLEGIYLNNYYPMFTIGGGASGTLFANSETGADLANVASYMKDNSLNKTGALTYKHADASKVWAYMVPVGNSAPRIVFKLENVSVNSIVSNPSTQYITVKKFTDAVTGAEIVIKRGEVYVVKEVKFQGSDLTIDPNEEDLSVTVTVEVKGWKVYSVDPHI